MNAYHYSFQFILDDWVLSFCLSCKSSMTNFFSLSYFLVMIEKLRKTRNEKRVFTAFLTDMSKAFDSIPDQLLIAKLSVYGFDMKSLAFISAYLKKRKQKLGPPSANV